MIKAENSNRSCYAKNGNLKSRWKTDKEAIENAKYINTKYPKDRTKLVAYKCPVCHHYHLTTKKKRIRK